MLIALITLLVVFAAARFLTLRYTANVALANLVAAAIVVSFFGGFIAHALLFPATTVTVAATVPPPPVASQSPAPPQPAGTVVSPLHRVLSADQIRTLVPAAKPTPYAIIEYLGRDGIAGNAFPAGVKLTASGWAGDPATNAAAAGLLLIIDDKRLFDETPAYGKERLDVARAFKTMGMLRTGFSFTLPPGLAKGPHRLTLAVLKPDGRRYQVTTPNATVFTLQ